MRKIKFIKKITASILGGLCLSLSSCSDFLNVSDELASNLTLEQVFESAKYAREWHANIFNCIPDYSFIFQTESSANANPWPHYSNETAISYGPAQWAMFNGFNASNAQFHRFGPLYTYIRQAHMFINRVVPIGKVGDIDVLTQEDVNRMKSEAKFFIAFSYFSLFELYGPLPIVDGEEDPSTTNFNYPRASVNEMTNYIDGLLQEVLDENTLPKAVHSYNSEMGEYVDNMNEMVRPTQATVLALRAKLWVYAASPLFNGGYKEALELTDNSGKKLFEAFDKSKWETAKRHLESFLTFAEKEGFELYRVFNKKTNIENPSESVYELFQTYNREIIWATSKTSLNGTGGTEVDRRFTPRDINSGLSGIGVSQQSVDAFFTRNGLDIKEDPEYNETGFSNIPNPCTFERFAGGALRIDKKVFNMYANREPRFYHAVTYQGKSWHIQPKAGWFFDASKGGPNDNSNAGREIYSGYILFKRGNETLYNSGSGIKAFARPSIIFRLADFYLYYAEVCNELNAKDPNVIEYLDRVRSRAGIAGYKELHSKNIKTNVIGNYEAQAKAIRKERQVELFTEGQRYFDIRRWMICGKNEEADMTVFYGMNREGSKDIAPGNPGSYFNRTLTRNQQWIKAMYLYPIPHTEVVKCKLIVQNPLW